MASNPLDRPPPHHHVPTTAPQHFPMPPDAHAMSNMAGMNPIPPPDGYPFVAPPPPQHAPLSPTNSRKRRASDVDNAPPPPMAMQSMPPPASAVPYGDHELPFSAMQQSVAPVNNPDGSAGPPSTPLVKKSRTNTPWTPAEEHRLKLMRDAGNSWSEIAKTFPNRTEGSVKKHWYKDMHYAEFAEDESAALLAAIKEYEASKWKVIGQKLGKPAKACEQYAKEHFGGKI